MPRWGGYDLEEEEDVLKDGTKITKLVRVAKHREWDVASP